MKELVESTLLRMGGMPKRVGHIYAVEMLCRLLSLEMQAYSIYDDYRYTAHLHHVSPGSVERSLRNYLLLMWDRGSPELKAMFSDCRPTNKEFISTLWRRLSIEIMRQRLA